MIPSAPLALRVSFVWADPNNIVNVQLNSSDPLALSGSIIIYMCCSNLSPAQITVVRVAVQGLSAPSVHHYLPLSFRVYAMQVASAGSFTSLRDVSTRLGRPLLLGGSGANCGGESSRGHTQAHIHTTTMTRSNESL